MASEAIRPSGSREAFWGSRPLEVVEEGREELAGCRPYGENDKASACASVHEDYMTRNGKF